MMKLAFLALLAFGGCLGGCAKDDKGDIDMVETAKGLEAAGFKGRAVIIYGTGHVAGQAFNLSGSSGFIEVELNPGANE